MDGAKKFRLVLGVNKDGLPAVGLLDKSESLRLEMHLDQEGNPSVLTGRP
jgi:hypothetical protein